MSTREVSLSNQNTLSHPPETHFADLPEEVTLLIFSPLNLKNLNSLLRTNRHLKVLVSSHFSLWAGLLEKHFSYPYKEGIIEPFEVFKDLHVAEKVRIKDRMRSKTYLTDEVEGHKSELRAMGIHQEKLISLSGDSIKVLNLDNEELENSITFAAGRPDQEDLIYMGIYQDKLYLGDDIVVTDGEDRVADCKIKVHCLKSENEIGLLRIPYASAMIRYHCTHENLLIVGYNGYTEDNHTDIGISIWDMNSDTLLKTIKLNDDKPLLCLAATNNTLFAGHCPRGIFAWDLKDYKYLGDLESDDESSSLLSEAYDNIDIRVNAMCTYKNKFIYGNNKCITVCEIDQQSPSRAKRLYSLDTKQKGELLGLAFFVSQGLLFTTFCKPSPGGTQLIVWDLGTCEKIMELNLFNITSLAMHRGKLFIGRDKDIEVCDFLFPHYEPQLLDAVKEAKTKPELTQLYTELLMLAFCNKDRNKMIDYAEQLLAIDPANNQFCECLCEATSGLGLFEHEFFEKNPFDHKVCLKSASFDEIEKALFYFTKWLKTEQITVDGPVELKDPENRAIQEEKS